MPSPTPCPAPATVTAPPPAAPDTTRVPTQTATQNPPANYSRQFLASLSTGAKSCLPDKTSSDLGIYIYDLTEQRELVSINADVPFQFASAFKGPVLAYFLAACRGYWDPDSEAWPVLFQDIEAARNTDWYTTPEYEQILSAFISDPRNWKEIGAFSAENRYVRNGSGGPIDTRYFVLEKVYGMIAQSNNGATADVLKFIFDNCPGQEMPQIEPRCQGPNAITSFNAWFNDFARITYENDTPRRGLYGWDTILEKANNGPNEIILSTYGLKDRCANQTAILKCDPAYTAFNTYTARDLFKFYDTLYNLEDDLVRQAALALLSVDEPGPARGNLKNMARAMHALSFSKNGQAFYTNGSIDTDAGIILFKGRAFVVVTLSFNAISSLSTLYGAYDEEGNLATDPGLIQKLLEEATESP